MGKSSKKSATKKVQGWASFRIKSNTVDAYLTETGGHLAPVTFDRKGRKIKPYHIAPWGKEKWSDQPKIIQVLRGDFFCMPFGGNDRKHLGEEHPVHGETANRKWKLVDQTSADGEYQLQLQMKTKIRPGVADKTIRLVDGHNAVYSRHVLSGFNGNMPIGHHACISFPDKEHCGQISTSKFVHGQVYINPTEDPAMGGYSILKPGAKFNSLKRVARIDGQPADLSRFPARRGYEDIAIMVSDPKLDFAWTAVSFPSERYVWFALKDPKMLASTLMWISNAGRHYAPWNGRHANCLGLEEITGHFHEGLLASVGKNSLTEQGYKTCIKLSPDKPTTVNYIMACVPTPIGFNRVKSITASDAGDSVTLLSESGYSVEAPIDMAWLSTD